jgi:UDP-N-acetylmuramoylalanine--D-glutamate ligase
MKSTVAILGLGASGLAAARLALAHGENVHVSDLRQDPQTHAHAGELRELGADVELGHHDLARIQAADIIVVSPGIPPHAPVLRALRDAGRAWISEPDYAVRFLSGSLIGITGTNGKTTTTLWLAHLLRTSGLDAAAGGNVGGGLAPAASTLALREPPLDWVVLEMSSFQLADSVDVAPEIGIVTTLSMDHQDRYPDMATYAADKARMFQNARSTDQWILNGEQPLVLALPGEAVGTRYRFAIDPELGPDAHVRNGVLTLVIHGEAHAILPLDALPLAGRHNIMNALAVGLAAALVGVPFETIARGLATAPGIPHRMETVGTIRGVRWINDSKATNVEAASTAIVALNGPVIALLGGKDKGEDFRPLADTFPGRVSHVLLFGEAGNRLERELSEAMTVMASSAEALALPVLHRVVGGMDDLIRTADALAEPGHTVLLSPACSSFDAFPNYEVRGKTFAEAVRRLGGEG